MSKQINSNLLTNKDGIGANLYKFANQLET